MDLNQIDPEVLEKCVQDSGLSFKTGSNSWVFNCPKCGKKDKLYIRKKDGRFICFSCVEINGFSGGAEYALSVLTGQPLHELKVKLYHLFDSENPTLKFDFASNLKTGGEPLVEEDLLMMEFPVAYYPIKDRRSARGQAYLASRGINLEVASDYGIRYAPLEYRVVFPVIMNGELVGWQKRWVKEAGDVPKILSSDGIPRDRTLMFHDNLIGAPHAIITEGPVDAIKCAGLYGNVAAMGKVVTEKQLKLVLDQGIRHIYLALDPDAAQETFGLIKKLHDCSVYIVKPLPGYKDLGEMSFEQTTEAFQRAVQVSPSHFFFTFT